MAPPITVTIKPDTKKQSQINLGRHVSNIVTSAIPLAVDYTAITEEYCWAIGKAMDKALRAGIKAQIAGKQNNTQVTEAHVAARKAMNRALARMTTPHL